jgi:hypothetical protein
MVTSHLVTGTLSPTRLRSFNFVTLSRRAWQLPNIALSTMLRWTSRLRNHLISNGHEIYMFNRDVENGHTLCDLHEAEWVLDPPKRKRKKMTNANPLSDLFDLLRTEKMRREFGPSYHTDVVLPFVNEGDDSVFGENNSRDGALVAEEDLIDVLWLSPTEFVSKHRIGTFTLQDVWLHHYWIRCALDINPPGHHLCFVDFCAYGLPEFNGEEISCGPAPEQTIHLLRQLLAPWMRKLSSISIELREYPSLPTSVFATMTSLFPRKDHVIDFKLREHRNCIELSFHGHVSNDHMRHLSQYPFHPIVCLRFEGASLGPRGRQQFLNDLFRQFQHLRQLRPPECLLHFDSESVSFTSNPAFEQLVLEDDDLRKTPRLPQAVLEGLAGNKNTNCLTLHSRLNEQSVEAIISGFFQISAPAVGLSLVPLVPWLTPFAGWDSTAQSFLSALTERIASDSSRKFGRSHGLSHFFFRVPGVECPSSNATWDSLALPSLLLNWLHNRRKREASLVTAGPLKVQMAEFTIRAVNQGSLIRNASNLIPYDLSTSSASVIYDVIRQDVELLGDQ